MYQIIINETDLQDKEGFESFFNKNLHSGKQVFHVGKFFSILQIFRYDKWLLCFKL